VSDDAVGHAADAAVRAIAFYLPQFHAIPENDRWWGTGFTEWTNVRRARPRFPGHEQPKTPGELGWYDLTDPRVAEAQAALARAHGLHGFCYYFYWFNGHRLLERPLEAMLARGTPDFPFCVCWANENWTRRWDGREQDVLVEQHYGFEDSGRLFDAFLRLFRDRRYIRVGGRPLLLVYKAALIPDLAATVDLWRRSARAAGEAEPWLVACETTDTDGALRAGFDATVEFPPHRHQAVWLNAQVAGLDPAFTGLVTSYRAQVVQSLRRDASRAKRLRCVFPSWDNTARRERDGTVFAGASPETFGYWVEAMARDTRSRLDGDERLLFVNAWNEWAEGCCLEPDARHGRAWLEALRDGLDAGALAPRVAYDRPSAAEVARDAQAAIASGELALTRFGAAAVAADGVSIVMPVYNHARFLDRTLASFAAQTRLPAELVAVDDGSSDDGAERIARFAASAPFPVTLARQRNRGAHVAINRGIALARAGTIALANSDDVYRPRRLERLAGALDDATALAFSGVDFLDDDDAPAEGRHVDDLRESFARVDRDESLLEALVRANLAMSSGNLVFRRALLDRIGGFAAMEVCHDWDWVLAATRHTRVARIVEPLYGYRMHGANTYAARALAGIAEAEVLLGRFLARIGSHPWLDDADRARLRERLAELGREHLWPAPGGDAP